jgi:hypothetical protein
LAISLLLCNWCCAIKGLTVNDKFLPTTYGTRGYITHCWVSCYLDSYTISVLSSGASSVVVLMGASAVSTWSAGCVSFGHLATLECLDCFSGCWSDQAWDLLAVISDDQTRALHTHQLLGPWSS